MNQESLLYCTSAHTLTHTMDITSVENSEWTTRIIRHAVPGVQYIMQHASTLSTEHWWRSIYFSLFNGQEESRTRASSWPWLEAQGTGQSSRDRWTAASRSSCVTFSLSLLTAHTYYIYKNFGWWAGGGRGTTKERAQQSQRVEATWWFM